MTIKKLSILTILLLSAMAATAQDSVYLFSYFVDNGQDGLHLAYSHDGLKWEEIRQGHSYLKPELGKDKLMRDPSIVQTPEGTFAMVWTTGWWDKTIGTASSPDLINWSPQQSIPVMEHEPTTRNSWAPELFYDSKDKLYYIIWASTIPDRHSPIATTEHEKGLNHRQYYTTTPDFKNYSETKLFFNPDFSVIDGSILKYKNEYLFFVKNENSLPAEKNIRIVHTKNLRKGFPIANVSEPIYNKCWVEGAAPIQIGKYIYVYFDKYNEGTYGAVRSIDSKNWEDVSNQIEFPKGVRHGTAFKVSPEVFNKLKNNE